MKIIATDNYARETIEDQLIAENMSPVWAKFLAAAANESPKRPDQWWFKAVEDDYVLSRGMEDLV